MLKTIKNKVKALRKELEVLNMDDQKAAKISRLLKEIEQIAMLRERMDKVFHEAEKKTKDSWR
jgi:hypothetical protein